MKNIKGIAYITAISLFTHNTFGQSWQWSKQIGGSLYDSNSQVCNDKHGNVYLAGSYASNPCYFDSDTLLCVPTPPQRGLFLAKYNSSGNVQWLHGYKGTTQDSLNAGIADITYDSINDYIYVCGNYSGSGNIDGISLPYANGLYVLLAKFDLNGNCIWAKQAGGSGCTSSAVNICIDADGNVIITGQNLCTATFDSFPVQPGYFLAKYNSSGNCLWAEKKFNQNFSPQGFDALIYSLEVSGTDIIGFGGCTVNSFTVDTTSVQCNFTTGQCLLIKFDSTGTTQWARACAGNFQGFERGLAVDENGNSYISAAFAQTAIFDNDTLYDSGAAQYDLFFAKYNSSGNLIWVQQANASNSAGGGDISITGDEEVYLLGGFRDTATFGNNTLVSIDPGGDLFVAKYDTGGNCMGVIQAANTGGGSISVDSSNSIYVSGSFNGSTTFGSNPTLTSYGQYDIFFAKSSDITGEDEHRINGNKQLFIYANPTTGVSNVTIPDEFKQDKNLTLSIYANDGKLIQQKKIEMNNDKIKLNLEAEAKGVYNVSLSNGLKSYSGKIVFE